MGVSMDELVGRWRMVDDGGSSTPYPQEIEFFPDRTYKGAGGMRRRPVWDEASFDVLRDGSVRIQTVIGRSATYSATLTGDLLTLVAGEDHVSYVRTGPR